MVIVGDSSSLTRKVFKVRRRALSRPKRRLPSLLHAFAKLLVFCMKNSCTFHLGPDETGTPLIGNKIRDFFQDKLGSQF